MVLMMVFNKTAMLARAPEESVEPNERIKRLHSLRTYGIKPGS
jgi:hypothetical protein